MGGEKRATGLFRSKSPASRAGLVVATGLLLVVLGMAGLRYFGLAGPPLGGKDIARDILVGHIGGPLLGPLYAAAERGAATAGKPGLEPVQFAGGADIGYALLSGKLDAGFMETDKALALLQAAQGSGLKVAGAIEFPYGATLVVRKDLDLRLENLPGRTVAARDPHCVLLRQFEKDAVRHGVDFGKLKVVFLSFSDLLPALEAKIVDAALLKGSHALLAQNEGHRILYQNWDTAVGGDDCCPATLAQVEFLLVVRDLGQKRIADLVEQLAATAELAPDHIRQTVAKNSGYAKDALEQFPVSWFARLNKHLESQLGEGAWCERHDEHDH